MARSLYTLFFYLITPLILLRLLLRARKAPAYARRWGERFGFVPRLRPKQVIWVHAVSVGETLAAVPLIRRLQADYPDAQLVVTTMTPTGSERVTAAFGDSVYHVYAPYDLPDAVARFIRRVRPDLLVIMETELWPNLIAGCAQRKIPVLVANARLSAKSAKGYSKVSALVRPMLQQLSGIAAQHQDDGQRFVELGLPEEKLQVTGNIKFDLELSTSIIDRAASLKQAWRSDSERPILLAASTHRGEDPLVLDAYEQLLKQHSELLLVLVPRHPERFDEVATLCEQRGFSVVRRSAGVAPTAEHQILLGDTMGELLTFCGASDVVFMGGSWVPVGGHNVIEPAAWSLPVFSGPHLFNFTEASSLLLDAGGMKVCDEPAQLAEQVSVLLNDESERQAMGAAAKAVAEQNRGALERLLAEIRRLQ